MSLLSFKKTLAMAYARAPYKEVVMGLIERICSYPDKNLARFNGNSLTAVAAYLGIDTRFIYSSQLRKVTLFGRKLMSPRFARSWGLIGTLTL
jgi:hypothetical protein